MSGKEREAATRELVEASDKVLAYFQRWKAVPTVEHQLALHAARLDYLEAEASLAVFMREQLEGKVKVLESRLAEAATRKNRIVKRKPRVS